MRIAALLEYSKNSIASFEPDRQADTIVKINKIANLNKYYYKVLNVYTN